MEIKMKLEIPDLLPESVALGTAAMLDQREKGIAKYHKPIEAANLSARELVIHAQQEMADGLVYTSMLVKKVLELEEEVARLRENGRADLIHWVSKDGNAYCLGGVYTPAKPRKALEKILALMRVPGPFAEQVREIAEEGLK